MLLHPQKGIWDGAEVWPLRIPGFCLSQGIHIDVDHDRIGPAKPKSRNKIDCDLPASQPPIAKTMSDLTPRAGIESIRICQAKWLPGAAVDIAQC
jgi:hypothetical protein